METPNPNIYQEKISGLKWGLYLSPIAILPLLVDYFKHNLNSETYLASALLFFIFISIGALMNLQWKIDESNFSYKMRPFHFKWHQIPFKDIDKIEVLTINPLKEFGGWGYRFGKLGKAYTISGNKIIHIVTKSQQKLNFSVVDNIKADKVISICLKKINQGTN